MLVTRSRCFGSDGFFSAVDGKFDADAGQGQRVCERDQIRSAFGALNRRDACNPQHVAFLGAARGDHRERRPLHEDAAARAGDPMRFCLGTHVHHMRLAARVEMRQFLQVSPAPGSQTKSIFVSIR